MIPAELPVFKNTNYYAGILKPAWAVFKRATNYNDAVKILMYFTQPEISEKWTSLSNSPTGLKKHTKSKKSLQDNNEIFRTTISNKYKDNLRYYSNFFEMYNGQSDINQNVLENNLRLLLLGKITAEDAFNEISINLIPD